MRTDVEILGRGGRVGRIEAIDEAMLDRLSSLNDGGRDTGGE
jgi:hypothetical protein